MNPGRVLFANTCKGDFPCLCGVDRDSRDDERPEGVKRWWPGGELFKSYDQDMPADVTRMKVAVDDMDQCKNVPKKRIICQFDTRKGTRKMVWKIFKW